jgi:hypothetical protein
MMAWVRVPLDCWFRALDACGYGRIRIVELPPAPNSTFLIAASKSLETASDQYRRGDYSSAATSARTGLDNIIDALRLQLKIAESKSQWGRRVDQIVEALDELSTADKTVTYKLYSDIIKSLYGFSSSGAHPRGTSAEDAQFILTMTTALYCHVSRVPLPAPDRASTAAKV